MQITRRNVAFTGALTLAATGLLSTRDAGAQSGDVAAVNAASDALVKAMMAADKAKLEDLVADQLSYGHSSGKVETKAEFVEIVASKKTIYKSITLSDASAAVVGSNAILRHIFSAETEAGGKAGSARVGVMQVWQQNGGRWKLLARQAFRLPA